MKGGGQQAFPQGMQGLSFSKKCKNRDTLRIRRLQAGEYPATNEGIIIKITFQSKVLSEKDIIH